MLLPPPLLAREMLLSPSIEQLAAEASPLLPHPQIAESIRKSEVTSAVSDRRELPGEFGAMGTQRGQG